MSPSTTARALCLASATLALALSAGGCDDKKKKDDKGSSADEKKRDDGTRHESAAGRYAVTFPYGKPLEKTTTDHKGVTWSQAKSTEGAYDVYFADFADAAAAKANVDDYLATMKGKILEERTVKVGAHDAKEITMKVSETATMWLRIVAVDKRVYKFAAGTKGDKPKAMRFLDSFELL
jgi:hypothetical protein